MRFFETLLENPGEIKSKCPVRLLILDINMPGLNGLLCNQRIRELYKEANEKLRDSGRIMRPLIVYMTQTPLKMISNFIKNEE